ncbi:MAG: FdrA family protein, partial [Candidatus Cloacimonetes bacterium]|nr:FdrA family protein [Candidatus Cloacimonadota bacterium]
MILRGFIKTGEYFDSVSLMIVSKEINKIEGIVDSAVIMGTKENKSILNAAGLLINKFQEAGDTDLLIVIKAETENVVNKTLKKVDDLLEEMRNPVDKTTDFLPKSFEGALKFLPEANLSIISVAGKYAAHEARKALENGLHVMIFSDNVSIEDEIKLKKYAQGKNLLVMGPDCGTAIINGIPLAFANVVNRGDIGIVAASGTGLQEVSSIISNEGKGISQAIGTGGRDVTKKVGGIMFVSALRALVEDKNTKIIILVSKPPHEEVLRNIADEIQKITKLVVTLFIGIEP